MEVGKESMVAFAELQHTGIECLWSCGNGVEKIEDGDYGEFG